ncbi:MAG: hypothetical protein GY909_11755 [Oligoflexia bacterium]|nr:hypothetical protein [Oligoflexia bacterium]
MKFLLLFTLLFSVSVQAKLLDKTMAVINDKVITLSQVKRVSQSLEARRKISPQIFNKKKFKLKEIVRIKVETEVIRKKLEEIGYIVSDDQVESQIKDTERRLRLNRKALLQFLKSNRFTFDEYFELIRETIEYNIFLSRVIQPLVSITDQELKHEFFKKNKKSRSMTFKYTLSDFTIPKNQVRKKDRRKLVAAVKDFKLNGNLKGKYAIEEDYLGELKQDGLTKQLQRVLRRTSKGEFSKPILIGNYYHIFHVRNKEVVDSEAFLQAKNRIYNKIFSQNVVNIKKIWMDSESSKHYIKYF